VQLPREGAFSGSRGTGDPNDGGGSGHDRAGWIQVS
jgi:hypothetical protein